MNINPLANVEYWVTHAPWWQSAIYYFLAIVLQGDAKQAPSALAVHTSNQLQ